MAEDADFQYGGVAFPLATSTGNSLLEDADPALFHALAFFQWVIESKVGARLLEAAAVHAPRVTAAVAYAVPFDPGPYLTSDQLKFPLLAVYRSEERLENRTITWKHAIETWGVAYVLPPMTAGQVEAIGPILNAVARALDERTEQGADPDYTPPGGAAGESVWARTGLEQIGFRRGRFVRWEDGADLVFQAYVADLEVQERVGQRPGAYPALTSVAAGIDLRTPGEADVTDVASVEQPTT